MEKNIYYEQPLNERMRTLLRLEFLLGQALCFLEGSREWDARATIVTLLDIHNILSRSDIKSELLKELERVASVLESLQANPNVDSGKLDSILDQIDVYIDRLHSSKGPLGSELRGNELLNSVKQRLSIPGGACDFDLPGYHFWLTRTPEKRIKDLRNWFNHFDPIYEATQLILRLLRDCAQPEKAIAESGFFQCNLDASSPCQLIRVGVPADCPYYAEISGGKHRFSVRFMKLNMMDRDTATTDNIAFELTACTL